MVPLSTLVGSERFSSCTASFTARPWRRVTQLPTTIGPYRILAPLGQGGMGVVYRAEPVHGGEPVALKTVRLPHHSELAGIRREIHALSRIRHPGVVRILAEGLQDGLPWYAMELLEGVTLQQRCQALLQQPPLGEANDAAHGERGAAAGSSSSESGWWTYSIAGAEPKRAGRAETGRPPSSLPVPAERRAPQASRRSVGPALGEILTLARRLCDPLAFLHGEGIVHRDLKPANVLIRADGQPVIVDFGLVTRLGSREALEAAAGSAVGTMAYMAPEQIEGELADARSDLYALGCLLYEMLTGQPPFPDSSPLRMAQRHLEEAPRPPSELADGVPPQLDALVLRLLAKDPRQRPGYARDVAAALARLGAQDGPSAEELRPRVYLYRPGFLGREELTQRLAPHLERLRAGSGALVLLGGESGVGKTRLAAEMSRAARRQGLLVLSSECQPSIGGGPREGTAGEPLSGLRQALQAIADRCRERGEAETERLLGPRGKVLSRYEPAMAKLPGLERHPEPVELPAEAALVRLYDCLARTFAALAEERPVLLVLDDLQWADELSLGLLQHLLRAGLLDRMPVLVLGTYRSDEVGPELRRLLEAREVEPLCMERLGLEAIGGMVRDMLALTSPPPLFVRFLHRHSEGNPFFLAEYLRSAVQQGLLWRNEEGFWEVAEPEGMAGRGSKAPEAVYEALPLPDSIRSLVRQRLDRLEDKARLVAEMAAVLGREMDSTVLARSLALEERDELHALHELVRQQVLEEAPGGRLRFVHDKLREAAYEQIEEARRPELHRRAAGILEALGPAEGGEQLAVLGGHWEQGGVLEKARGCYLAAARTAASRYALAEAERLYRATLRLVEEPGSESIAARDELATRILRLQGRNAEALEQHRRALEEARGLGDREAEARGLLGLSWIQTILRDFAEAEDSCRQALELYRQGGDRRNEGRSLSQLAQLRYWQGRLPEAMQLCKQALLVHHEAADRHGEGLTLTTLASVDHSLSRLDEARAACEQALALHREAGDRFSEANILSILASRHQEQGRFPEAQALLEESLAIDREIGARAREGVTLANLANAYGSQGQLHKAIALHEEALVIHRELGDRMFEALTLGNLANLWNEKGQGRKAEELCRRALALGSAAARDRYEGYYWTILANALLLQGRLVEAQAAAEQALAIQREAGSRFLEAYSLNVLADLRLRQGQPAEARELYEQALPMARAIESRDVEVEAMRGLASIQRKTGADPAAAEPLLQKAESVVRGLHSPLQLISHLCERGHLELCLGRSARESLVNAQRLVAAVQPGPESVYFQAAARLQRAVEAFEAGQPLVRGECTEDQPGAPLPEP
jgi:serine/threonine protein kinase/predicted ATPase